jgi:predicted O-methyltransferase YrrM
MRRCETTLEAEMTPTESAFLRELLTTERRSGPHLEIGTAAGGTLCHMMACFPNTSRPPFVVVDRMTYFPQQAETVRNNLNRHGLPADTVDFRIAASDQAFQEAARRGDRFDFMLIDACHKIRAVTSDLKWTRLLNVNGLVCLHDYTPKFPGVMFAVDRFLSRNSNYEVVGRGDSLLAIRKRAASSRREVSLSDSAYGLIMSLPLAMERKIRKWNLRKSA